MSQYQAWDDEVSSPLQEWHALTSSLVSCLLGIFPLVGLEQSTL